MWQLTRYESTCYIKQASVSSYGNLLLIPVELLWVIVTVFIFAGDNYYWGYNEGMFTKCWGNSSFLDILIKDVE
jgi:hypothetical protein